VSRQPEGSTGGWEGRDWWHRDTAENKSIGGFVCGFCGVYSSPWLCIFSKGRSDLDRWDSDVNFFPIWRQ